MNLDNKQRRVASKSIPISKKLLKLAGKTNAEFKLIGEGDKVLVGLSGGKDSLALVHIMKHIQRHAPFNFEFEASAGLCSQKTSICLFERYAKTD